MRPGLARMGCTVSFVCCEEDFLQMYQHEFEEKAKENLTKVRISGCGAGVNTLEVCAFAVRACLFASVCRNSISDAVFVF